MHSQDRPCSALSAPITRMRAPIVLMLLHRRLPAATLTAAPSALSAISPVVCTTRLRTWGRWRPHCGHRTTARHPTAPLPTCGHRTTGDSKAAIGIENDKLGAIVLGMHPALAPTAPRHEGHADLEFTPGVMRILPKLSAIVAKRVRHVVSVRPDDVN